jgi:hypothetical protein
VPRPLSQSEYASRISIDGVVTRTVRDTAAADDYLTRIPNGGSFIKIGAMDETQPGYQSVLSQLTGTIVGWGVIYFIAIGSLLAVLCLSANTSFVCAFWLLSPGD